MERRPLFERINRDRPEYDVDAWHEEERQRRIARHEAFHRIANEHAWQATEGLGLHDVRVFCECGHRECERMLLIPRSDFAHIHTRGDVFLVTPGHEIPDLEHVIDQGDGYLIVEKDGLGRLVAIEAVGDRTIVD